jgi:hypothetical protein
MKHTKRILSVDVETLPDYDHGASYLEQDGFEDRLQQYHNREFGYIGIRAVAKLDIDGTIQTITSGGLWGIEDDSDQSYLNEVADEEKQDLRSHLHAIGFSKRAIAAAL